MSLLRTALHDRTFVCVMEFVPKPSAERFAAMQAIMDRRQLCGWPLTVAIGDRVASALDLSPLDALDSFATPLPALPHFSGKNRERHDLLAQLQRMQACGQEQLLILTGDRLPGHQPGERPVRYLESVAALQIARQAGPHLLLGAALNPFKYREEEGGAQYCKAEKKLAAGADFLTLQLGFDAGKHHEALQWMQRQAQPKPLLACLMSLTHGRAAMLEHVAGVTVTPSMLDMLEAEAAVSKAYAQARSVERLALQIIGVKLMGYAGVHLSGIHALEQLVTLEARLEHWQNRLHTLEQWAPEWAASWQMPGLPAVTFHPPEGNWRLGETRSNASFKEKARYHLLHGAHALLFSRDNWLSKTFGWAVRQPLWATATGARVLHRLERSAKRPLVGCDTCGRCRLEDTLYICPETCPKGLANGPCGGTTLNRCEFGDRECIHSVKYRIAVAVRQTAVLTQRLIPCISAESRHQSSWPVWFDAAQLQHSAPSSIGPMLRQDASVKAGSSNPGKKRSSEALAETG